MLGLAVVTCAAAVRNRSAGTTLSSDVRSSRVVFGSQPSIAASVTRTVHSALTAPRSRCEAGPATDARPPAGPAIRQIPRRRRRVLLNDLNDVDTTRHEGQPSRQDRP
jgi:hypothetical protein